MISVSSDIGKLVDEKSDNDLLSGSLTMMDFSLFLKQNVPNFHKYVTMTKQLSVGKSIQLLHEHTHMLGKPIDGNIKIKDESVRRYLHSLSLAIKANSTLIESFYDTAVDC
jgi:hypothetical protein